MSRAAAVTADDEVTLTATEQRLLVALRDKRLEIARKDAVPAYIVFSDRTLADMALRRPASRAARIQPSIRSTRTSTSRSRATAAASYERMVSDWWEHTRIGNLEIVCTPARHASGRTPFDKDATLWASYALLGPRHRVARCLDQPDHGRHHTRGRGMSATWCRGSSSSGHGSKSSALKSASLPAFMATSRLGFSGSWISSANSTKTRNSFALR